MADIKNIERRLIWVKQLASFARNILFEFLYGREESVRKKEIKTYRKKKKKKKKGLHLEVSSCPGGKFRIQRQLHICISNIKQPLAKILREYEAQASIRHDDSHP